MKHFRINILPKSRTEILVFYGAAVVVVAVLLLLSGCGVKQKLPAPAVALDSEQPRITDWYTLMREKRYAPEMAKLEAVNSFFNQLEFVDDLPHWGKEDYWATPREMLASNGGDCEDFATAKYFTLRQLAIADEKMRLTYVKALKLQQPHMVLSYYAEPDADPLILDSLVKAILFASQRPDLIPIYSFNGQGLWSARKEKHERLRGPEGLSLWQDLQLRFSHEAVAAPLPEYIPNLP